MRLLKRERSGGFAPTHKFILVEFEPRNLPQHAILSHRWGPDEVTFEDVKNNTAKRKVGGYQKLEFCAEQAARDGLLYFWIDTCCIDKTNSTELSEAINSMFKWYQNAAKCYVYLTDVSITNDWESALQQSQWFNRGWTLQELIAPATVEFFSVERQRLGDKKSLEKVINQITGISTEALRGKPLAQISVDERFSWTARRLTTVDEDMIYCLLGIFDIHMALIYGEGQQKALARLQRKINKSIAVLETPTTADAPWIVPFERNPNFTGRDVQLAEVREMMSAKYHTSRIAITGLGGIGKTQLLLETLYRTRQDCPNTCVIWIPAMNVEALRQGYVTVAQGLGLEVPTTDEQYIEIMKIVQIHLSGDKSGPWLLVYDNADDVDMWTATFSTSSPNQRVDTVSSLSPAGPLCILDYLPQNKQGSIIFTTRDKKAAVKFAQRNIVTVSEMSEKSAFQLITRSLVTQDLVNDTQNVLILLKTLAYLPLAITQAAAFINANEITVAEYVSLLDEKEEENFIDVLSEDFEDHGRYRNMKNPIATTWLLSFEHIRRSDPLAADYLSFIACVEPRNIPQSLLPQAPSRKRELEAIGTLNAYSFVRRRPASTILDAHRLVHLTTRNWLRKEQKLVTWIEKATKRLLDIFPEGEDHKERALWRLYLPHVRYVLASELTNQSGKDRLGLMWVYGKCLISDGRGDEAEPIFRQLAASDAWHENGEEYKFVIGAMTGLGIICSQQGRWEEAGAFRAQALEASKARWGADHPNTLKCMSNLAQGYREQAQFTQAEEIQVEVVRISKIQIGSDHLETLLHNNTLAAIYFDQGRWSEAENLWTQVLNGQRLKLGADHPTTLTTADNLGSLYRNQGRLEEAEKLQSQVVAMKKESLGAEHPDTVLSMNNLALTYSDQERWNECEELNLAVIQALKTKFGCDHHRTLATTNNLAVAYVKQGRLQEAEKLQNHVLQASKARLPSNHPDLVTHIAILAGIYARQRRWKEAEELEMHVFETRSNSLGKGHPDTLNSMHQVAFDRYHLGRRMEAMQLIKKCIEYRVLSQGATHPLVQLSKEVLDLWNAEQPGPLPSTDSEIQDGLT